MHAHDSAAASRCETDSRKTASFSLAQRAAELRHVFVAAIEADDIRAIARAVVELAEKGNLSAARLTLLYVIGKPGAAVEPDRDEVASPRPRMESPPTLADLPTEALAALLEPVAKTPEVKPEAAPVGAATSGPKTRAARKAAREAARQLRRGIRPSPNGSNGPGAALLVGNLANQPLGASEAVCVG